MQYFFNDHLRWNLGFETPNQGGAWVATLLPWLWGLTFFVFGRLSASHGRKCWGWRLLAILFVAAEYVVTWALVKTYSRGALVGVLTALGLATVLSGWLFWRARRRERLSSDATVSPIVGNGWKPLFACFGPWLGRGALLVLFLGVSDFTQRLTPDYASSDKSVTNRVDLWKGGLELIAISPMRGWGWGESGASFMHWTQPIGRSEGYKSMVNSYLTVGVEGGLPVMAVVLCGCFFALFIGIRGMVTQDKKEGKETASWLPLAAAASWLAWLVCLLFSNLWIIPLLWVIPAVTIVCLGYVAMRRVALGKMRRWLFVAGLIAVIICGGLWALGSRWESALPLSIARVSGGKVTLASRNASEDTERLVVLPDAQVLGEAYGQELRRWVIASPYPLRLAVIASPDAVLPVGETVVAFGAACSGLRLDGRKTVRIHPTQSPEEKVKVVEGSILQLPGIDVGQHNADWEAWAAQSGLTAGYSWGLATDVRSRWPEMMLSMQTNLKKP